MRLFARTGPDLPSDPSRLPAALEATLKVSEIASSAMPVGEAIRAMLQAAAELLGAEQGSAMLLEGDGRTLVLAAAVGLPAEVAVGYRLPLGEGVAGRVLATGRPVLLGEVDGDAYVNFIPKQRPISSSIVVPLRVQGRAIGVLSLAMSQPSSAFDDDDLRIAQMFADQAAGSIHRARLHERAEQRSSDLMALVESSRGLPGTLDLEELLHKILDGGTRLAGSKDGLACLFDRDTGAIAKGVFRGIDKPAIRSILEEETVRAAVQGLDVRLLDRGDARMLAAVGLRTSAGMDGVLVVDCHPDVVRDRVELLKAFGQQCSVALSSAELYTVIERKEAELSSIIQGVPNPILLVDAHSRIVALNPAAEELFGVSASFSAGAPVKGTLGMPGVEELVAAPTEMQTELTVGAPPRTYKARVTDIRLPGVPFGRVLMMDDVTNEREMAQIQRDFVAMIGHELRTPLTIVKGFARTLLRRLDSASRSEAREALTTIDARAEQLERLIEDLLYVSRIEAREASLRIDQADVVPLVRAVAEDVVSQYPDREVLVDMPDDLAWPCDDTKVGLVLRHLIENGLKYSKAPTTVTVRGWADADELRIDVADRGVGLVSSDIPHIFERFRQLDGTSTREHGGTGTGLYLCAQLVRMHGGRIWVDSTWGKGSVFSFALPKRSTGKEAVRIHAPGADHGVARPA